MECNRDEALRAKELAEKKFTTKDFVTAKKLALKAQNLFPALEGINQMIATLDVYLAAEMKINGESDWYTILCVNASADDETVKKQYRKLALQLHPDKNKSVGAEGAFQLVSEAWSVLSDKSRKMIYDQKRSAGGSQLKMFHPNTNHSAPAANNGFYTFVNNTTSRKKSKRSTTSAQSSAPKPKSNTFWTSCNRCKMQYEYLRVYLNHNLLCPNCHEAFLAVETGFPSNGASSNFSWTAPQQHQKKSSHKNAHGSQAFQQGANLDSHNNPNFQWGSFSRTAGTASATAPSSVAAQAANVVHQTYEKVKREREEAQAAARREEALRRKSSGSKRSISSYYSAAAGGNVPQGDRPVKKERSISDETGIGYGGVAMQEVVSDSRKTANTGGEMERGAGCLGDGGKMKISRRINRLNREIAQFDRRILLMNKAKHELSRKLEEWNAAATAKLTDKAKAKQKQRQKDNGKVRIVSKADRDTTLGNKPDGLRNKNGHIPYMKQPTDDGKTVPAKEVTKTASIVVPDPEFHDFDKDRLERSFEVEQVWATYDNEDGMPRFYVLVQKVLSLRPFKLRMSFLNSKSNSELGPMNWVASGFAKTCGDFRIGRYVINDTVNIFSHRVTYEKGPRGVVRIVPRKGDTWALYKNWSPDWNELTPDNVIYKYEMVEVIDDYSDKDGVLVTPLVKVAGFRAVFHRHMDPKEIKSIPREEMFRFSHQVPSYLLTGEETHNAPKGCREMDPAAIPSDLLQVITEFKEDEVMETTKQQPAA